MKPLTTVVMLTTPNISIPVQALLDSASAGNFISGSLCRQLKLSTTANQTIYQIHSITGKPIGRSSVRFSAGPVQLRVGQLHEESIHLLVLEVACMDIILGRPWFAQHEAQIYWCTGEVLKWGNQCFPDCFPSIPKPRLSPTLIISVNSTSIESPVEKQSVDIPTCYA